MNTTLLFSLVKIEDEEWIDKHRRYGVSAPASEREKLNADRLERMIGILEMATGQADPIPLQQAETLFVSKLGMSKVCTIDTCRLCFCPFRLSFMQYPPPLFVFLSLYLFNSLFHVSLASFLFLCVTLSSLVYLCASVSR